MTHDTGDHTTTDARTTMGGHDNQQTTNAATRREWTSRCLCDGEATRRKDRNEGELYVQRDGEATRRNDRDEDATYWTWSGEFVGKYTSSLVDYMMSDKRTSRRATTSSSRRL